MYQLRPRVFDREADRCFTKTMTQLLFLKSFEEEFASALDAPIT
ncbi:hypothetical protein SLEP1_g23532 [Rubroshorea leprosula]|uniref:Uncharacterized protein n=1 Tax=Rubroshorea leprosula TaxID=152421 RepID=A0AAV5JM72_9ROSI|nr:hypothetical protein SLEP1_g23532 [Rubroshorea leprosula]